MRKPLLLLVFILFQVASISAQSHDTLSIYLKIKKIAYRHKATTLLYHAIFVDPAPKKYDKKPLSDKQKDADPIKKYEGKIIRKIVIIAYDPFGFSVNDTNQKEINPLQKIGNSYHVTTRKRIVNNLLLFKVNEPVDLLVFTESERILRQTAYISDARIYVIKSSSQDSVDVKVVVQDKWNVDVPGTANLNGGHLTLRDRNVIGSGQRYEQYVGYKLNGTYEFTGRNAIGNIGRSFISSSAYYTTTNTQTKVGLGFSKPFYSALANWAGGISGNNTWASYSYLIDTVDKVTKVVNLDYYDTDVWIAKNVHPITGKVVNRRISNLTLAFRYAQSHFQNRPSFAIDTSFSNVNTSLYLGSVGFALSKFYKDSYIFRFGANEDVPEGLIVQYLYGVLFKEKTGIRYYTGFDISRGRHYENIGYFSGNVAFGTLFNELVRNNSTFKIGGMYFSDLLRSGKWSYRQFLYLKYTAGINKPTSEKITLRTDELYGFSSGTLAGNSKIVANIEAVSYAPYNIIGFKFAPVLLLAFGMIETDEVKLFAGHVYQAYSAGFLIRNENLLTSSFKVTCGFYPYLPDNAPGNFKFDPFISFTLKVQNFFLPEPSLIVYD